MSDSTSEPARTAKPDAKQTHRREVRLQIILPFALAVLLIIVIFVGLALMNGPDARTQIGAVADFTASIMLLCPAILCLVPVYLLLVAGMFGANKLHSGTQKPLDRLQSLVESLADRIVDYSAKANGYVTRWSVKLAPVMQWMRIFDGEPGTNTDTDKEGSSDE